MRQKRLFLGVIGLALLPLAASAQIYQDVSNSTATVVRDPARQASTEIDAVLFNPAGTALLDDGWHLSLSGKLAYQNFNLSDYHSTVEKSMVDYIPSLQAAYKKGKWAFSFSLGNEGGYGHSFLSEDPTLSGVLTKLDNRLFDTYKEWASEYTTMCDKYDQIVSKTVVTGDLYNFSARIGAAFQINSHLSAYLGLRLNYVTEKTTVNIDQWIEKADGNREFANDYFTAIDNDFRKTILKDNQSYEDLVELCNLLGIDASYFQNQIDLRNSIADLGSELSQMMAGISNSATWIDKRTNGWGISPVIGVNYSINRFNFAAKYEFETKIHTQGNSLSYHVPNVLSLGASWQIKDNLKVSAGGSWYWQNFSNIYGRNQTAYLNDIFNIDNISNTDATIKTPLNGNGKLNSWDASASVSFSPVKDLTFSFGYTYNYQRPIHKGFWERSISFYSIGMNVVSGGLRYDINDRVQLDCGISKKMSCTDIHNFVSDLSADGHHGLNMSAGININL